MNTSSNHRNPAVERIESVGFTVSDMEKAIDFYTTVLPFEKVSDSEFRGTEIENLIGVFGARIRVVRLKLGNEFLELTQYINSTGRPIPLDSKSNDGWFQHIAIVVSDMDSAYQHLRKNNIRYVSNAPQTLPEFIEPAAGIKAFYFRDFDDHVLEVILFPPDKLPEKWQDEAISESGLFLGIDHTAIIVKDTEAALKFYCDRLGLKVSGESLNYGTEQEHLTNVEGAKMQITSLKTKKDGIGVEFLEYIKPNNGRPFPKDTKSDDLWHWQINFVTENLDDLSDSLNKNDFVSDGVVAFENEETGFEKAFSVRDADGHMIRISEE